METKRVKPRMKDMRPAPALSVLFLAVLAGSCGKHRTVVPTVPTQVQVVDFYGTPVAGILVSSSLDRTVLSQATTGTDGTAILQAAEGGRVTAWMDVGGPLTAWTRDLPQGTAVTLPLSNYGPAGNIVADAVPVAVASTSAIGDFRIQAGFNCSTFTGTAGVPVSLQVLDLCMQTDGSWTVWATANTDHPVSWGAVLDQTDFAGGTVTLRDESEFAMASLSGGTPGWVSSGGWQVYPLRKGQQIAPVGDVVLGTSMKPFRSFGFEDADSILTLFIGGDGTERSLIVQRGMLVSTALVASESNAPDPVTSVAATTTNSVFALSFHETVGTAKLEQSWISYVRNGVSYEWYFYLPPGEGDRVLALPPVPRDETRDESPGSGFVLYAVSLIDSDLITGYSDFDHLYTQGYSVPYRLVDAHNEATLTLP